MLLLQQQRSSSFRPAIALRPPAHGCSSILSLLDNTPTQKCCLDFHSFISFNSRILFKNDNATGFTLQTGEMQPEGKVLTGDRGCFFFFFFFILWRREVLAFFWFSFCNSKGTTQDFWTPKHVPKLQGILSILYNTTPSAIPSPYLQRENKVCQEYDIRVHHIPNTIRQTVEDIKYLLIYFKLKTAKHKLKYLHGEALLIATKCKIV